MERLSRQSQQVLLPLRPTLLKKLQKQSFIWTVDLVSENGMTERPRVNADLVETPGGGQDLDQGGAAIGN